jgi:hypothetical protein
VYGAFLNPGAPFYAQVEKEIPGYNSATAIKVVTKNQSALTGIIPAGPFPSLASNAVITINTGTGSFDMSGGLPYNNNPDSVSMWIKNAPVSGDSTEITVLAIDNSDGSDSIAAVADTLLGATIGTWTKITLPFIYSPSGFSTTLIRVMISSSGNFGNDTTGAFTNLHDGTSVSVDDIDIAAPNGIVQYIYSDNLAKVYPTECKDLLHVNLQTMSDATYSFELFSMNGALIKKFPITQKLNIFDLSALTKGNYLFTIQKNNEVVQSGKMTKL